MFANRVKSDIAKQGGLVDLVWYVQKFLVIGLNVKKLFSSLDLFSRNVNFEKMFVLIRVNPGFFGLVNTQGGGGGSFGPHCIIFDRNMLFNPILHGVS